MTALVKWAEQQDWRRIDCIVSVGIDPSAMAQVVREYSNEMPLICVMPPDYEGRHEDKFTTVVRDPVDLRAIIATKFKPWHDIYLLPDENVPPDIINMLKSAIGDGEIISAQHDTTVRRNSEHWTKLGLELLPRMIGRKPINAFTGALKGRTGIIVGAGPGLDRNIEVLKNWQGKCVIAAVATALPALAHHGINPDFVCVVDANDPPDKNDKGTFESFKSLEVWDRARSVLGVHSHPLSWDWPSKHGIAPVIQDMLGFGDWLSRITKIKRIPLGGSVATLCFSVLVELGCSRVIMVGCDNAYITTEKQYAEGIDRSFQVREHGKTRVLAWGGIGFADTTYELNSYRQWFETKARMLRDREIEFINATESGARIHGMKEERLRDLSPDEPFDANALLDEMSSVKAIDKDLVVRSLQKQIDELDAWHDISTEFAKNQQRQLEIIKKSIGLGTAAPILAAMCVATVVESMNAPKLFQLESQLTQFQRIAQQVAPVKDMIESCLKEIQSV
jgi:hypothetical protein